MKKSFKIYQMHIENNAKFMSLDFVKENNLPLALSDYENVYEGEVEVPEGKSNETVCDHIYMKFQGAKPEGYKGHSISMSDVIELDGKFYYCDEYCWEELDWSVPTDTIEEKHNITLNPEHIHFAQNGDLLHGNIKIGTWEKEVIGGRDRSGNKLVPFLYWIKINDIPSFQHLPYYSRKEVREHLAGKKVTITIKRAA